jgi:hypothetical protein
LELPVHPVTDKHVAWEQRKPQRLGAILPSADGTIEGKIDLVTFLRKRERHGFLVLMARENGVPVWRGDRAPNFHFHIRQVHIALPCDLQGTLTLDSLG